MAQALTGTPGGPHDHPTDIAKVAESDGAAFNTSSLRAVAVPRNAQSKRRPIHLARRW